QMQPDVAGALAQLTTHPEPDPVTVGVLHAEGLVDMVDLTGNELVGDREQVDIIGLHQRIDFTESQEIVAAVQAQHGEHRLRPENPAAGEVPVPQAAAPAVERGIAPATDGDVDKVASEGPRRLPVKGETE